MSRYPMWTEKEIDELRSYMKDGCTYAEAAELMGRTECSVANFCKKHGMGTGTPRKKASPSTEDIKALAELKAKLEAPAPVEVVPVPKFQSKSLSDFTPREMIKHLYDLGYRIEGNKLVCMVKQTVNLKDIING